MWLLVMLVFCCGWAAACPGGCSCYHDQDLYVANCSSLPTSGGKVESLNLLPPRDSPLELSDGQFNAARHLKYLNLRNCSIYFIHKKAFYGATSLVEIDLSFNYIEELDPTVFQHLTSLKTLILRGNAIHFMPEVPFLISNSLQHLDLGHCKIRNIPRGIFYGLKRLRYLCIDKNFLKTLKYNSLPKGLKYLNISENLIVNVPTDVLSVMTNLRRIGLGGNPVNCTCSLMNLQDWFSGRGVTFEDNVTCYLPSEYYGLSWSKVDENRLCLEEVRREEISHSTIYDPFFKNRLYRGHYFENENTYIEDSLQSDQPQPVNPDSETEVLFQNDETIAMGEMMRDEEDVKKAEEEPHVNERDETDEKSVINEDDHVNEEDPKVETKGSGTILDSVHSDNGNKNEEKILSINSDAVHIFNNGSIEVDDLNLQDIGVSEGDSIQENKAEVEEDYDDLTKHNDDNPSEIVRAFNNSSSNKMEKMITLTEDKEENDENLSEEESVIDPLESPHSVNLSETNPVEFKPLNEEESNTELDDFKKEGLFHVGSDNYKLKSNETSEESTAVPDIEDTTEDEVSTTQETLTMDVEEENNFDDAALQNTTSSSEINGTIFEDHIESEEDKVMETIPPAVVVSDLFNNRTQHENYSEDISPKPEEETSIDPSSSPGNNSLTVPGVTNNSKEEKIKEVAGAEVVMFCVAVLIICLILYSVYKCRTSHKRKSMTIVKDMESSRGTEMQDMASLIPKPKDDDLKNNAKYPDKALASETMKLITEQNENELPNFTPVADVKNKIEDKNSLNNNTPSSPTSKTPLIKPGNPITINPAAPIQRTKVKVGILPDSIPRTPIFLQKAYNNGTKKV